MKPQSVEGQTLRRPASGGANVPRRARGFVLAPLLRLGYRTVNCPVLAVVPPALVTVTGPLVASAGTVAEMKSVFRILKVALTPLKVTDPGPWPPSG